MAFSTATVTTNLGKAMLADRLGAAGTYTASPKYVAIGVGASGAARTAAATDTTLSSAVESRTNGTISLQTTTTTNDTYQVVGSIVLTAGRNIDEAGLFDASTSGNMGTSATFGPVALNNGDTIQQTWKLVIS